jgi:hypothetical protein
MSNHCSEVVIRCDVQDSVELTGEAGLSQILSRGTGTHRNLSAAEPVIGLAYGIPRNLAELVCLSGHREAVRYPHPRLDHPAESQRLAPDQLDHPLVDVSQIYDIHEGLPQCGESASLS